MLTLFTQGFIFTAQRAIAAALFGILLLLAFALSASMDGQSFFGFYRYDYLFFAAVAIQLLMLYFHLETLAEAKVIALFHVMAMVMELILTDPHVGSWQYPEPAVLKILTVPLFAGFMYSAIGSFFARAIRLFEVSFQKLPPSNHMLCLAIVSYINFMSKFFIHDLRSILFVWSIAIFWKTKATLRIDQRSYQIPMLLLLVFLAFLIWIAENISTFYDIWVYPNQENGWQVVWWGKIGSWYLLLLLSLVLILKILGQRDKQGTWTINTMANKKGK
ncbi:DUF817 family protein [Acinetobacter sp. MD2(2019)]|uniref:DUF817 family protein n=1 Tax=Acinetobacter sp. MD2(2019) TaxID=2605273 RepID=UPI002D1F669D|nr:DUF817 family protein [Acinetobacter sp. MD2(2019)]MEB3753415.1 DUF817 family protein [Acinetobacter sp. MD2(2019)]